MTATAWHTPGLVSISRYEKDSYSARAGGGGEAALPLSPQDGLGLGDLGHPAALVVGDVGLDHDGAAPHVQGCG